MGSGGHCLGELLKKQELERSKLMFCHFYNPRFLDVTNTISSAWNSTSISNWQQLEISFESRSRMEQSYESGYVLHHISRISINLWQSQTARIRLSSLVSHTFKFYYYYHLYAFVRSQSRLHLRSVCSFDPPTTPVYQPSITEYTIRSRRIRGYKSIPMTTLIPTMTSLSQSRTDVWGWWPCL